MPDKHQYSESEYAAIGRRVVDSINQKGIRDPEFVEACHQQLLNGDRTLLETLPESDQRVMQSLHTMFQTA